LLSYQYLQMMPKIAEGSANKLWIVPSEIGKAMEGLGSTMNDLRGIPQSTDGPKTRVDMGPSEPQLPGSVSAEEAHTNDAVAEAIAAADAAANPGKQTSDPAIDPTNVPATSDAPPTQPVDVPVDVPDNEAPDGPPIS